MFQGKGCIVQGGFRAQLSMGFRVQGVIRVQKVGVKVQGGSRGSRHRFHCLGSRFSV